MLICSSINMTIVAFGVDRVFFLKTTVGRHYLVFHTSVGIDTLNCLLSHELIELLPSMLFN